MAKGSTQKYWHELFGWGMLIKGFNGVWETISGILILLLSKATLSGWFFLLSHNELLEDRHDVVINFLANTLQNFSSDTKIFVALYLLVHGFLNIFLVIQLYRDKHWAYLVIIGTVVLSMGYQVYRISVFHSSFLMAITIFDVIFVVLAWHEYVYHRDKKKNRLEMVTLVN